MPPITTHQSSVTTKTLYIGDSGTGKTGSLASLAAAGYQLRILDIDNGLDVLKNYLTSPTSQYVKANPKCAENVHYFTLTDPMRSRPDGKLIPAKATVWSRTMKLLMGWKDPEFGIDYGPITSWTPKDVLVVDSLTALSTAALNFHLALNGWLGNNRTQNEARRDIYAAQSLLRDFLSMLYDDSVKCNVIVLSHITLVTEAGGNPASGEATPQMGQGYPSAIGRALSPQIPRYFNSMLIARTIGSGSASRHKIYTTSQVVGGQIINAKSSAPLSVKTEYPLETGLADYFKAVQGIAT